MRGSWLVGTVAVVAISSCSTAGDSAFESAVTAFQKGDYQTALSKARKADVQSPNTREYMALLSWILMKQGDVEGADNILKTLQKNEPIYPETIQLSAWMAYTKGDLTTAAQKFEEELAWAMLHKKKKYFPEKYLPKDVKFINNIAADGNYGLSQLASAKGDQAATEQYLLAAESADEYGGHDDILLALANIQSLRGDHKMALATLGRLHVAKAELETYPIYLRELLVTGDYERASSLADKAATRYPYNALYPLVEALVLAAKNHPAEADAKANKAMEMYANPYTPDLLYTVAATVPAVQQWAAATGQRYFDLGAFSAARLFFGSVWKKDNCHARLMTAWSDYNLGSILFARYEFETIVADKCSPLEEALTGQGANEFALGKLDVAEGLYRQALVANPRFVRASMGLGAVAYARGKYGDAAKIYGDNIASLPANEPVWSWRSHALNNLGWALYFTKNYQVANGIFQKLNHYQGKYEYPSALAGIGWSSLQLGRRDEAKAAFEKSLNLAPGYTLAKSGLDQLKSSPVKP